VPPPEKKKGSTLRAYLAAIALLVVIFGAIGVYLVNRFAALADRPPPPPVTVAATAATLEPWDTVLDAVGTIRAVRGVELAAETSGEVISVPAGSGQSVATGDLLLVLDDSVEQAARKRQEAQLELAQLLFERDASLVEQKSIPQSQYDRSRADLQAAMAQLAEIEARIDNKRIRAPFAGTLGIMRVRLGDYVESGTPITTLQDLSELELDFTVPARYAPWLRRGQTVSLSTAAFPDRRFPARLQALDSAVDANTRNLLLRARLEETDGLLPGMFASVRLDLGRTATRVTVPETAVSYSLQGNLVYLVLEDADGLYVEPQIVTTGRVRGGQVAILDGLQAGERVVTVGQNKLYRGARIVLDGNVPLP
jgi:membrane fusion protein (multidrug efflux system)